MLQKFSNQYIFDKNTRKEEFCWST